MRQERQAAICAGSVYRMHFDSSKSRTKKNADDIKIYSNKWLGSVVWGSKDYDFPIKSPALNKYKVLVPYAWGNMYEKHYLCGTFADIIIASPNEACTETYLESGCFDDYKTAKKHAKYLMTKFARALLYVNKTLLSSDISIP